MDSSALLFVSRRRVQPKSTSHFSTPKRITFTPRTSRQTNSHRRQQNEQRRVSDFRSELPDDERRQPLLATPELKAQVVIQPNNTPIPLIGQAQDRPPLPPFTSQSRQNNGQLNESAEGSDPLTTQLTVAPDDPISQSNEQKPEDNGLLPTPLQQFEINRPSPVNSSLSAEQLSSTEACSCPQTPISVFEAFRDQFGLPLNDLDTEWSSTDTDPSNCCSESDETIVPAFTSICRHTHRRRFSWPLCGSPPSEKERACFRSVIVQQFNVFDTSESRSDNE
ncbi:hypothetical protein BLNAU_20488 [Blattamonas nauphoetae]|uniref:Uncharacterized protein n=1 Tax=Blattamonas nauphoetae TaxID=2049346 RepID=A0ABQ9WYI7_9EUKA|nr:hypothetical protein BLNAU_20488 [Blattamonas nauphoetae]